MSLFNKMFSGGEEASSNSATATSTPATKSGLASFGRYTDMNKNKKQLENWKSANDNFKAKKYIDAYENFMNYLRDEGVDNVQITRTNEEVSFEITQGSKVIRGKGDGNRFLCRSFDSYNGRA